MEAAGGFEPPNKGFADLSLRPLGYTALNMNRIIAKASLLFQTGLFEHSLAEGFEF